jgi:signal transduction histidine kinase
MASGSKRRRVFRRYAAVLVGLVTTVLVTSGGIEAYFAYQDNKDSLGEVERAKAANAATVIEQFVGEIQRQVASTFLPGQIDDRALKRRRADFFHLFSQVPALGEMGYIDWSGKELFRVSPDAPPSGEGRDRSDDPVFTRPNVDRPYFGPVTFKNGSEPHMTMALREQGTIGGVTFADVGLKFARDAISGIKVGDAGHAYVVDSNGNLIIHPDITLILARKNLSSLPQVRAALDSTGSGKNTEVMVGLDPSGGKVLTATHPIPSLGWHVFVEQPLGEVFAPLYAAIFRTIVLLIIGLALAALASLILTRRMVAPIEALQAGAARVATGDWGQPIDVRTGDELQALAEGFNRMTEQLRESYAELEQRVEDRTRDLAVAMEQLEEKGQELEAVSRHKSEFLANMSHELRTPLNAIIGFSEVLHEQMFGELNEQQMGYVADVLESGQHLLSLINDILDLSKVEAGRMELELSEVSLPLALQSGLTMQGERAGKTGITLGLSVHPEDLVVRADERKLRQIVFNLLSNAVKFTPPGGRVDVSARLTDGVVEVAVTDTGSGIAPEDQELIFEEFQQARRDPGTRQEGTGLGLPLSRRFVELHGGRLWVESEQGVGSTFRFTLPVRRRV